MGRLFWKVLAGFWLSLLLVAFAVGSLVSLYTRATLGSNGDLAFGPRVEFMLAAAAAALSHGGTEAVRKQIADWPPREREDLRVTDRSGRDLFARPVPATALAEARELSQRPDRPRDAPRLVQTADGSEYLLFVPDEGGLTNPEHRSIPPLLRRLPPPTLAIIIGSLAGLTFSALLVWYLMRRVRVLRRAFSRLASGDMDVRIGTSLGHGRDELHELGRDFDRMATRLQALLGAQRRLLHDVSHELRSPLARLQAAVGLARQQPERNRDSLERIEREGERLNTLVGELLTLSRLEAGVEEGQREPLDFAALLDEIASDARFEATTLGREVHCRAPATLMLAGHAEQLHRAVDNVIRNALKYARHTVDIELSTAPGAAHCQLRVCDDGPGVEAADLPQLFEPFFRVSGGDYSGYGLGLTIARCAVGSHGGRISASNRPGGGLCVCIELPLAAAD